MLLACRADFEEIRRTLQGCIAERESEFLSLGEQLQRISGGAMQLTQDTQQLITATADDVLDTAVVELSEQLETTRTLCASSDSSNSALLQSIQTTVHTLLGLIASYSRITKTLQMLGVSTRIESARLGSDGKGFTTLADDVEKLARKIVEYSGNIKTHGEQLELISAEAAGKLFAMHAAQEESESTLFASVNQSLEQLQEQTGVSRRVSGELTSVMEDITGRVGSVVSSMQFHDIVRQQVEHVEETLDDVLKLEQKHGEDVQLFSLAEIGMLQSRQLNNARTSFYEAVEQLKGDLRATGELVVHVASVASSGAAGNAVQHSTPPIETIAHGISEISSFITEFSVQGEHISTAIAAVVDTITQMSAFLEDIEDVGTEIGLIAMNASIRAAHTGEKGRALGVLAGAIQHLSLDAGEQTTGIAKALSDVGDMAEQLNKLAADYFTADKAQHMTDALEALLVRLEDAAGSTETLLHHVVSEAETLSGNIDENVRSITIHDDVCAILDAAEQALVHTASAARSAITTTERLTMPDDLQAIASRYTMEKERDVHRTAMRGSGQGVAGEIDLFGSEDDSLDALAEAFEDEFGDNIELF